MAEVAVIGLGNMGLPMAANLVRAGHSVRGFDAGRGGPWWGWRRLAASVPPVSARRRTARSSC